MLTKLSDHLLKKESLDIIQIIDILGQRPHPLPETVEKYIIEVRAKEEEKELRKQKAVEEQNEIKEEEIKEEQKEEEKKDESIPKEDK